MRPFTTITSKVIPLPQKDIDTDLIIPAQYLTSTSRGGYGVNLFRRLRDGNPDFPLNQARYSGAQVLLTGSNFGCGSSREHAVWALLEAGVRVVISRSFADIFTGNSAKNGLLLLTLPDAAIDALLAQAQRTDIILTVDLAAQLVGGSGISEKFSYDQFRKHCLLQGLDDLDYILSQREKITDYRRQRRDYCFFSTLSGKV